MQIHFEILVSVGELETQEARLISLGAKKSPHQDPNDPGLIVMLDPRGIRSAFSRTLTLSPSNRQSSDASM